ncbi:SRPBCC domain-containing protein [Streptomyces sp. CRN 30]|uniref:SRPBCC family protein n=1 Tax=Streptomyces sp. CRN 30 TaxID=3075613 RepID=UPI002A831CBA|nr:SRPBCC domain-containing protein [Streptomyces sp. CRN 30]
MSTEHTTPDSGFSYTLIRTLDVPPRRVWQAWTSDEQYARWAGAVEGSVELDARPGGVWKSTMVTPDGARFALTGSYLEVEEGRRLVIGMDAGGTPAAVVMTVELGELSGGRTRITVSQTCATAEERDMAEQGSTVLLDGLGAYLAE